MGAAQQEQETDVMLLLARREREELKEANKELREQQDKLRSRITAKRRGKAEIAQMGHFSEAYDWVCEITKLTAVSARASRAHCGANGVAASYPHSSAVHPAGTPCVHLYLLPDAFCCNVHG